MAVSQRAGGGSARPYSYTVLQCYSGLLQPPLAEEKCVRWGSIGFGVGTRGAMGKAGSRPRCAQTCAGEKGLPVSEASPLAGYRLSGCSALGLAVTHLQGTGGSARAEGKKA